ncbi:RHS repeat-associated core domain-containing protein [Pseudomonas sp. RC3H12]|uniref:RHS repeat-associated core domain-containing protein n=1 Tax=Pseudomonas sp. RC3H12 TaxID=2834406 RepID=UPI001BDF2AD6|nr:RHS repeat-associated core domain-containing protein [Pseudomonas sp. RC3H12]QWA30901.1 RHS repeat-associated core domain-containing protein [Pseudomonas sp. RC3H12]
MTSSRLAVIDQQRSVLGSSSLPRAYAPYGAVSDKRGALLAYCGQPRDSLTGHYHLGNGYRTFNPLLMRFNSPDRLSPFGAGGINAFAYCQGDPINFHDSRGTERTFVRSLLATAASAVGTAGANEAPHHFKQLWDMSVYSENRKILIDNQLKGLAGQPVTFMQRATHVVGALTSTTSAVVGWGAGLYLGATEEGGGHWATELGLLGAVVGAASISKISDMLSSSQEVNFGAKAKALQVDINDMYQEHRALAQSPAMTQVAVNVVEETALTLRSGDGNG